MKEGLLWYDDSNQGLAEKIARAAKRYRQKFGALPNTCYVHPSALKDNGAARHIDGVRVSSLPSVLRHHFWLGREKSRRRQSARGK
jgi:hypothetical protein